MPSQQRWVAKTELIGAQAIPAQCAPAASCACAAAGHGRLLAQVGTLGPVSSDALVQGLGFRVGLGRQVRMAAQLSVHQQPAGLVQLGAARPAKGGQPERPALCCAGLRQLSMFLAVFVLLL